MGYKLPTPTWYKKRQQFKLEDKKLQIPQLKHLE
jgi:hypothetical protein